MCLQVFDSSVADAAGPWCGPDEEFGVFAAAYGPPGTEFEDQALLAVNLGEQQSAAALYNLCHRCIVFDGYLLHSTPPLCLPGFAWFDRPRQGSLAPN
jgi:hypothetical protein